MRLRGTKHERSIFTWMKPWRCHLKKATHLSWRSHIEWRNLLHVSRNPTQTWWRAGFRRRRLERAQSCRNTFPQVGRSHPLHLEPPRSHTYTRQTEGEQVVGLRVPFNCTRTLPLTVNCTCDVNMTWAMRTTRGPEDHLNTGQHTILCR